MTNSNTAKDGAPFNQERNRTMSIYHIYEVTDDNHRELFTSIKRAAEHVKALVWQASNGKHHVNIKTLANELREALKADDSAFQVIIPGTETNNLKITREPVN